MTHIPMGARHYRVTTRARCAAYIHPRWQERATQRKSRLYHAHAPTNETLDTPNQ